MPILISGHSGGTGASPQTSIRYAGLPWEMGLSEAHQVLMLNRLRHRVKLRTDGGIKTGRDVVIAAMLGAEEFGIGTASLVAMGCIMVRQCHSNTCPVGVCTQDEKLRAKFEGTPEKVINLFSFIAEDIRHILASLGFRSLKDVIGRTDLLHQVSRGSEILDDLDLNPILAQADPGPYARYCTLEGRNEVPETLDAQMIEDARAFFDHGEKMQLQYNIRNTHRAIGTKFSSKIVRKLRGAVLQPDHVTVRLRGSAGQSLGAFRRAWREAGSIRRRERLCRQGAFGRHHRGAAGAFIHAGERAEHHHRQYGALRRDLGLPVRGRKGWGTLRGAQFRRRRGGGGHRL